MIDFFNQTWEPFGFDASTTRTVFALIVTGTAFHWAKDLRTYWLDWTRRIRRITLGGIGVIVVNAILLLAAAGRDDPLRVGTWCLALSYAVFNGLMLARFKNDDTTDRQYAHLWQGYRR